MPEVTPATACKRCGGPVSKKNTSGFCRKNPECAKASQAVAQKRWYETHREQQAEKWAVYSPGYKDRRTELDAQRREDPEFREKTRLAVQAFKTDPANSERVREYNQRGRQKYMARSDRPCLSADGCAEYAKIGSKFCEEHARIEAGFFYHRTAEHRRQALAEAQGWTCPWCQGYLSPSLSRTHVDHIIPRASGLVIEENWNFQLLHGRCNQQKSGRITPQAVALAAEHGLVLHAPGSMPHLRPRAVGYDNAAGPPGYPGQDAPARLLRQRLAAMRATVQAPLAVEPGAPPRPVVKAQRAVQLAGNLPRHAVSGEAVVSHAPDSMPHWWKDTAFLDKIRL